MSLTLPLARCAINACAICIFFSVFGTKVNGLGELEQLIGKVPLRRENIPSAIPIQPSSSGISNSSMETRRQNTEKRFRKINKAKPQKPPGF